MARVSITTPGASSKALFRPSPRPPATKSPITRTFLALSSLAGGGGAAARHGLWVRVSIVVMLPPVFLRGRGSRMGAEHRAAVRIPVGGAEQNIKQGAAAFRLLLRLRLDGQEGCGRNEDGKRKARKPSEAAERNAPICHCDLLRRLRQVAETVRPTRCPLWSASASSQSAVCRVADRSVAQASRSTREGWPSAPCRGRCWMAVIAALEPEPKLPSILPS